MIFWVRFSEATFPSRPRSDLIVGAKRPHRTVLSSCYQYRNLLYLSDGAGSGRGVRRGEPARVDPPRRGCPQPDPAHLHRAAARPRARARGAAAGARTARRVAHAGGAALPAPRHRRHGVVASRRDRGEGRERGPRRAPRDRPRVRPGALPRAARARALRVAPSAGRDPGAERPLAVRRGSAPLRGGRARAREPARAPARPRLACPLHRERSRRRRAVPPAREAKLHQDRGARAGRARHARSGGVPAHDHARVLRGGGHRSADPDGARQHRGLQARRPVRTRRRAPSGNGDPRGARARRSRAAARGGTSAAEKSDPCAHPPRRRALRRGDRPATVDELMDLSAVLAIVLIDLALSGDNAILIGMAARRLPDAQRRRAIVLGGLLAVVLRIAAAAAVTLLLAIPYLQLVGGVVLAVIAYPLRPPGAGPRHAQGPPGRPRRPAALTSPVSD